MRAHRALAAMVVAAVTLGVAACSNSSAGEAEQATSAVPLVGATGPATPTPNTSSVQASVPLYVVDRILASDISSTVPLGLLTGVTGTMAGGQASEAFGERLLTADPSLISFQYAAEAYDAVILAALGAAATGSDQGTTIARQAPRMTTGAQQCGDFTACLTAMEQGATIAFRGVSGAGRFASDGDPTVAQVGVYRFGPDNQLSGDVDYREAVLQARDGAAPDLTNAVQAGADDGILTIGTLLGDDGSLGFLNPAQRAGISLAVADIKAAGGVPGFTDIRVVDLSAPVESEASASPSSGSRAPGPGARVDVVIGPTSALAMRQALDRLATRGVLLISPTGVQAPGSVPAAPKPTPIPTGPAGPSRNPSPGPQPTKDAARTATWTMTAPSVLQGALLGSLPVSDGYSDVAILSNGDSYGEAMAGAVSKAVEQAGGRVVIRIAYKPGQKDFAQVVAQVKSAHPDAIVLTGGSESALLIEELARQGVGPNQIG